MKLPWHNWWSRWLARRTPRTERLTLTQRNVYIVPSKGGWVYALVVIVLLLAAINEQLNLAYALAFLLGGVGLSSMALTHGNLRGLSIALGSMHPVHAGDTLRAVVKLDATGLTRGRFGLLMDRRVACEVEAQAHALVEVLVPTQQRGWLLLPRWSIETTYPLGLFRAWSYWRPAPAVLVWPSLEQNPPPWPHTHASDPSTAQRPALAASQTSHDDDIREWQRGDALHQILWKKSAPRLASDQTPIVRHHMPPPHDPVWLDWQMVQGLGTEAGLSRLASWLVRLEKQSQGHAQPYGLQMPGVSIPPSQGSQHLNQCLDTLAKWELPSP